MPIRTLHNLSNYRDFITYKARADLRTEARRYYISYAWWIIEPLIDLAVYYVIFGMILNRGSEDFVPFLLIGLTTWKWFGSTVLHGASSIVQSKNLILQTYLPKVVFSVIVILTDSFKFFIILTILLAYLWISGFPPNDSYWYLPEIMLTQFLLLSSCAILMSALIPFFPDGLIILQHGLQLLFFMSGIFFNIDRVGGTLRDILQYNPMLIIVDAYRQVLLHASAPSHPPLLYIASGSIVMTLIAFAILSRYDTVYPRMVN